VVSNTESILRTNVVPYQKLPSNEDEDPTSRSGLRIDNPVFVNNLLEWEALHVTEPSASVWSKSCVPKQLSHRKLLCDRSRTEMRVRLEGQLGVISLCFLLVHTCIFSLWRITYVEATQGLAIGVKGDVVVLDKLI